MTDQEIEDLIWSEIRKRDITLNDMIGGDYIDPDPDDTTVPTSHRMRHNRFVETFGEHRLKELLCIGSYSPVDDSPPLKVAFQDLFRFWWDRCIEPELFLDEILRDIFDYFTDRMKPDAEGPKRMEVSLNFDQLDLFRENSEKAA